METEFNRRSPKITVVITAYNLEPFIARCFDELFSQTFQDFNILVVDDCSSDNTADIVRDYMARYLGRISGVFLSENLGMPALTRNVALDSGKIDGEYMVFLDGDDSIEPVYLEELYNLVQKPDTDIAVCAYDRIKYDTGHIQCVEMQGFPEVISQPSESNILPFINPSMWNKLIRTSIIGDIRFCAITVGEEVSFLFRLFAECRSIRFTEQVLIHYYVRGASIISNTKLTDIHAFATDMVNLYTNASYLKVKATIELATFIHIGVSMAIRAKDNPEIPIRKHLSWTRTYFAEHFGLFKGSRLLRFNALQSRGIRGLAIWFCLFLYKIHSFCLFLFLYRLLRKISRKDVKF